MCCWSSSIMEVSIVQIMEVGFTKIVELIPNVKVFKLNTVVQCNNTFFFFFNLHQIDYVSIVWVQYVRKQTLYFTLIVRFSLMDISAMREGKEEKGKSFVALWEFWWICFYGNQLARAYYSCKTGTVCIFKTFICKTACLNDKVKFLSQDHKCSL